MPHSTVDPRWAKVLSLAVHEFRTPMSVVDRLLSRFRHYGFSSPIGIEIGAACCPTHGTDVDALKRAADVREGRKGSAVP